MNKKSMVEPEILRIYLQILLDGPAWKKQSHEETAILILPGIYQEYRIEEGVKLWPQYGKYLWIAPTRGDTAYSSREKVIALVGKDSKDIIFGEYAAHTLAQMEWCLKLLEENQNVKHLIVATSAYHLPRCCLTLLSVLKKNKKQIPISPLPLKNPKGNSFLIGSAEDFQLELEKISQYQLKGDVLSSQDWQEYLNWRLEN